MSNTTKIICQNSFKVKDALKKRGYHYSVQDKTWFKEVNNDSIENETKELIDIGMQPQDIIKETTEAEPVKEINISDIVFQDTSTNQKDNVSHTRTAFYIIQYDYNRKYTICTGEEEDWMNRIKQRDKYLKIREFDSLKEMYITAKGLELGTLESRDRKAIYVECTTQKQLEEFEGI